MFKKNMLIIALSGFCMVINSQIQLFKNDKPIPPLTELLKLLSIKNDGTFAQIVAVTQQEQPNGLLRPASKERWEINEITVNDKPRLQELFKQLKLIEQIIPQKKSYKYAVVLGATIHAIRRRLAYLLEMWHQGVRFETIVFLVGQRKIDPKIETDKDFSNRENGHLEIKTEWKLNASPQTETDIAQMVYEQSVLPDEWRTIPVFFIDTPETITHHRPTTPDTIIFWLSKSPKPGSILAISDQPHIHYQDAVLRTYIPTSFTIETMGKKASHTILDAVILDALGRWIYQEYQLMLKK